MELKTTEELAMLVLHLASNDMEVLSRVGLDNFKARALLKNSIRGTISLLKVLSSKDKELYDVLFRFQNKLTKLEEGIK